MTSIALPNRHAAGSSPVDDLGTPEDWTASAIVHLRGKSAGQVDGGVHVSAAALHLALGYIEQLEGRLALVPMQGGTA
jgi:hypothetical protein